MPEKLIPISPSDLYVDTVGMSPSGKITEAELKELVNNVDTIYAELGNGRSPQDFRKMRYSQDPKERELGETYSTLFMKSSRSLRGEYRDGQVEIVSGRHRTVQAKNMNAAAIPVFVRSKGESELNQLNADASAKLRSRFGSNYDTAHEAIDAEKSRLIKEQERGKVASQDRGR